MHSSDLWFSDVWLDVCVCVCVCERVIAECAVFLGWSFYLNTDSRGERIYASSAVFDNTWCMAAQDWSVGVVVKQIYIAISKTEKDFSIFCHFASVAQLCLFTNAMTSKLPLEILNNLLPDLIFQECLEHSPTGMFV